MMKPDQPPITFKAAAQNTGAMTFNRRKVVTLTHPDGQPLKAGDLKVGQSFTVDPKTGITKIE